MRVEGFGLATAGVKLRAEDARLLGKVTCFCEYKKANVSLFPTLYCL